MEPQNPQLSDELLLLASDIREHLSCLHELGIERVENASASNSVIEPAAAAAAPNSQDLPQRMQTASVPAASKPSPPAPKSPPSAPSTLFGNLTATSQK